MIGSGPIYSVPLDYGDNLVLPGRVLMRWSRRDCRRIPLGRFRLPWLLPEGLRLWEAVWQLLGRPGDLCCPLRA